MRRILKLLSVFVLGVGILTILFTSILFGATLSAIGYFMFIMSNKGRR